MPQSSDRDRRIDPPERTPAGPPPAHFGVTDQQIRQADGLVLVDPDHPDWQQVLWTAEIGSGMSSSLTMQIVEIPVDSRDERQLEAVRERVRALKIRTKKL